MKKNFISKFIKEYKDIRDEIDEINNDYWNNISPNKSNDKSLVDENPKVQKLIKKDTVHTLNDIWLKMHIMDLKLDKLLSLHKK